MKKFSSLLILCRYELCFAGEKMVKAIPATQLHDPDKEKSQNHLHSANGDKSDSDTIMVDVFRWSRCKKPLPETLMRTVGIPLPLEYVEVFLNQSFISFPLAREC
jgi:hypothetical protein